MNGNYSGNYATDCVRASERERMKKKYARRNERMRER